MTGTAANRSRLSTRELPLTKPPSQAPSSHQAGNLEILPKPCAKTPIQTTTKRTKTAAKMQTFPADFSPGVPQPHRTPPITQHPKLAAK